MSSSQPSILLYAEFLSNIRQVSVGCDLPTPISITTRAIVCADGRALTVAHHGSSATIQLPVKVAPLLPLPITKSVRTSLAWKIPLRVPSNGHNIPPSSEESVPWSGIDLEPGSAVTCRTCKSVILNTGTLKVWKDLPSENWAEMMEFWHCHKPDSHKDGNDEEDLANRGYGASSRIAAQPGVGFVDLTSFLLAESDLAKASVSSLFMLFMLLMFAACHVVPFWVYRRRPEPASSAFQWAGHRYSYPRQNVASYSRWLVCWTLGP